MYNKDNFDSLLFQSTGKMVISNNLVDINSDSDIVRLVDKIFIDYNLVITNVDKLKRVNKKELLEKLKDLRTVNVAEVENVRKKFATGKKLESYTNQEYLYIRAKCSVKYGWRGLHELLIGNPDKIIAKYENQSTSKEVLKENFVSLRKHKKFLEVTLIDTDELKEVLTHKLEQPKVLPDLEQNLLIKTEPFLLAYLKPFCKYQLNDSFVYVARYKLKLSMDYRYIEQVFRVIINSHLKTDKKFYGQVLTPDITGLKFYFKTSERKYFMNVIEQLVKKTTPNNVAEQMLRYRNWWKVCFKHLSFTTGEITKRRYPEAWKVKELLFKKDTSWTFNSRWERAIKIGDTESIEVAKEKPKFLLRNLGLIESLSMNETKDNVLSDVITELTTEGKYNTRQLLEIGLTGYYTNVLNKKIVDTLIDNHKRLRPVSDKVNQVFVNRNVLETGLNFSGAKETGTQFGGFNIPSNSIIKINDETRYMRLGILWRGTPHRVSNDLDLGVKISSGYSLDATSFLLSYNTPEFYNNDRELLAVSSGDELDSNLETYSNEFIDIDLKKLNKESLTKLMVFVNNHDSKTKFKDIEAYAFVSFISKEERILPKGKIKLNLDDQDLAFRINENMNATVPLLFDTKNRELRINGDLLTTFNLKRSILAQTDKYDVREFVNDLEDYTNNFNTLTDPVTLKTFIEKVNPLEYNFKIIDDISELNGKDYDFYLDSDYYYDKGIKDEKFIDVYRDIYKLDKILYGDER